MIFNTKSDFEFDLKRLTRGVIESSTQRIAATKKRAEIKLTGSGIIAMLQRAGVKLKRPSVEFDCSSIDRVDHLGKVRF